MRMLNGRTIVSQGFAPGLPAVWQVAGSGCYAKFRPKYQYHHKCKHYGDYK